MTNKEVIEALKKVSNYCRNQKNCSECFLYDCTDFFSWIEKPDLWQYSIEDLEDELGDE